jgi:hypothetical protein
MLPAVGQTLNAVHKLQRGLLWRAQYQPVTKAGVKLWYCPSLETFFLHLAGGTPTSYFGWCRLKYVPIWLGKCQTIFCQNLWLKMKCCAFNMTHKANGKACRGKYQHLEDPRKAHMMKSQMKKPLITFSESRNIASLQIHPTWPNSQPGLYLERPMRLHEAVCRQKPEFWANNWFLHPDTTPGQQSYTVKQVIAKNSISRLQHHPHSPHLAPNDFWLFTKSSLPWMVWTFQDIEDIQQHFMQHWRLLQDSSSINVSNSGSIAGLGV